MSSTEQGLHELSDDELWKRIAENHQRIKALPADDVPDELHNLFCSLLLEAMLRDLKGIVGALLQMIKQTEQQKQEER